MKKIRRIVLLIVNILLLNCLFINSYVTAVAVTKENINESLQKFVSSTTNEKKYKISVSDNIITITVQGKSYNLNYDLTEKPKFTLEIPIEKGMSYADFKEKIDNLNLPMVGYIAVANIQGVEFKDASAYFLMTYLENAFNGSWSSENAYVIVDDTNMSDGIINRGEDDKKTIYASQFGEKVMEYVNATYKDKQTIKDSSDGINSYEWITERKDITDTSCKLVSSLSVNLNADFSKLNGYSNKVGESVLNKDITKENADYSITLKVGQKCRIETTEKITGYELYGSGYEYNKVNKNCAEITGKTIGKANGYIYVGEIKKSLFITVEQNTGNATLDTITLKINTTSETDKSDNRNKQQVTMTNINNSKKNYTQTNSNSLPKTGSSNIIYLLMCFSVGLIIVFSIILKKYKDIK